jgi:uncharacterized protein with PIN domain
LLKFVADGMLGRLTRWLRMLGHDVEYSTTMDDSHLMAVARREKRVLLTRDLELYKQATAKGVEVFYFQGLTGEEKLSEVARRFNIRMEIDLAVSRCPKCNAKLKQTTKRKVQGKIEENTLLHYDEFWKCPKCGQIYWQGSHWNGIRRTLESVKACLGVSSD